MKLETSNTTAGKQVVHAIRGGGNFRCARPRCARPRCAPILIEMHLQRDCRTALVVQIFSRLRLFSCLVRRVVKLTPGFVISRRVRADSVCYTER